MIRLILLEINLIINKGNPKKNLEFLSLILRSLGGVDVRPSTFLTIGSDGFNVRGGLERRLILILTDLDLFYL